MKNVVVIPMMIPKDKNLDKFGGWNWMECSKKAWEYWCKKNDCELVIYDTPLIEDTSKFRVTVQRWFDVFNLLEEKNIDYNQIAMIDAAYIPKWDCPNFFELTDDKFCVTEELDNLKWVYESIQGYKEVFDNYKLDVFDYFNTGLVIFNKSHKSIFENFKQFFLENSDEILNIQKNIRRGTDQTPVNYFMRMNGVEIKFLNRGYRVSHLPRKDLLSHNWQLNEDKTPFFIKYGYVWGFSGFDKTQRNKLMQQVWDLIGNKYE